jgi:hypothetical protein
MFAQSARRWGRAFSLGDTEHQQRNVLNELILILIQKRVLTDAERKALLQKLLL